jgi:hypothetical protein
VTELRLDPPYDHIVIEYPYEWAQGPYCVHVFDENKGTGTVYRKAWADALANGIVSVMNTHHANTGEINDDADHPDRMYLG